MVDVRQASCNKTLLFEQGKGSSYPIQILVVANADHLTLAQTGEVIGSYRPVGTRLPEIKQPDLGLGRSFGRLDRFGIFYLTLDDPVLRVPDLLNIARTHINDHTLAGKREERLHHV